MLAYICIALGIIFLAIYFLTRSSPASKIAEVAKEPEMPAEKVSYGRVRIYYGTQTGTAAKLAEQLAEEGTEQGFEPEVIDLKDVQVRHFEVLLLLCSL